MIGGHDGVDPLIAAVGRLRETLAWLRGSSDHWEGRLSTSALSTATAVSALSLSVDACLKNPSLRDAGHPTESVERWQVLIAKGAAWLAKSQNSDGGFGDTDRSLSNIATSLLVIAAWELSGNRDRYKDRILAAWNYVERNGSWDGLRARYGKDKTFVVPIMTNCALAGIADWTQIPSLPFEAAALPQSWYRFAQMPVVSYAVPALVAMGQAKHHHAPSGNPIVRALRDVACRPTLRVLRRMQPTSGGYLEAVPLTSFVLMSLASIGQAGSPVAIQCRKFICDSVLADGSWPIDTNLAGWVTALATRADIEHWSQTEADRTVDWLLGCQHRTRHPFTGAEPGGWGWTNLSGAVPDADDTPAALLALRGWWECDQQRGGRPTPLRQSRIERVSTAVGLGLRWLVRLQNRDGGWPTFCRGWGQLPFDRSGSDLTAHAIRALLAWRVELSQSRLGRFAPSPATVDRALGRGWRYLARSQQADGSWLPLWFGNQDRAEEDNPVYGTGRVLQAYAEAGRGDSEACRRGRQFLLSMQNNDGGWGGGATISYGTDQSNKGIIAVDETTDSRSRHDSSTRFSANPATPGTVCSTIEETSVAVEGLLADGGENSDRDPIMRALNWLSAAILHDDHLVSQPIGFYFARLWYHEQMYPIVYSIAALKRGIDFVNGRKAYERTEVSPKDQSLEAGSRFDGVT